MSTTAPSPMRPPDDAVGDAAAYRSLSTMAVVSLLLGFASVLNLASPMLLVLPIAAVGAALVALRSIKLADGALTGRVAAFVGISLAVVWAVASPVRLAVRDGSYIEQADNAAIAWLQNLASGRPDLAVERLSATARGKLAPSVSLGLPSLPPVLESAASGEARSLNAEPIVEILRNLNANGGLRLELQQSEVLFPARRVRCDLIYRLSASSAGAGDLNDTDVVLSMARSAVYPEEGWFVEQWGLREDAGSGR